MDVRDLSEMTQGELNSLTERMLAVAKAYTQEIGVIGLSRAGSHNLPNAITGAVFDTHAAAVTSAGSFPKTVQAALRMADDTVGRKDPAAQALAILAAEVRKPK